MFCPKCGTPLDDDALSCNACNSPVQPLAESTKSEPVAELQIADEETPVTEQDTVANEENPEAAPKGKKLTRRTRILLTGFGITAALAAVVALAIYLLPLLAGKGPATALYIKNNELFTTRLGKLQPWQVSDKLIDASNSQLNAMGRDTYAGLMSDYTYLTRDRKTLFYPDKYTPGDQGATIYYRNIQNPEEPAQRLDSNIYQYTVSPDGSRVVYLKSDGTLFRYNMQEKVKVADQIATDYQSPQFYTSEDCKNLIYIVGGTIYAQTDGGEKLILTSDCNQLNYVNNNCNTIYYTNYRGNLYKATVGEDKQKIAYDVDEVFMVYETGELYYSTYDPDAIPAPITASQFVVDDVPNDTSRDALRQELAGMTLSASYVNAVCYYDGKVSLTLAENCYFSVGESANNALPRTAAKDTPTLIFSYCNVDKAEKVNLSQVTTMADLQEKAKAAAACSNKIFIAVKGTATEIKHEDKSTTAQSFRITNDGKTAYYLEKSSSNAKTGDLYKFAIAGGKPQKAELYDTDVYRFNILNNSTVLYYCEFSENKQTADLLINQALVDYDVPTIGGYYYDDENQWLLYFIDVDKENHTCTLKLWEDNEVTKISDEVYTFECVDDELLYITDYNKEKGHGTLYLFQNDSSQKVDTEVSYIIDSTDDFGFVFRRINYGY